MERQRIGYGACISAAVIWALTSPGIKYLLDTYQIPTLTLAFWRDAFAALGILLVLVLFQPGLLRVSWRTLGGFAVVGAVSIGFYHGIWVTSVALNGAAVAVVLIYTFPVFVTLGAWLLFGERPGPLQFAALALSLLGCALLVRIYDPEILRLSWVGALIGLLCALVHSSYVLFSQRAVARHSPWTSLAYTMLFGALALALTQTPSRAIDLAPGAWVGLALLGIGPTLIGYALFTASMRYIPGRIASLIVTLEVPTSVLIALAWLGERLEWPQVLGMACVLLAVLLPALVRNRRPVVAAA